MKASFSLGRDVIGWRQSKTTGETLGEEVIVRQCARDNNGLLAGDHPVLDTKHTENTLEMKKESEERKIAHNGQGPRLFGDVAQKPNLHATQKESGTQNKEVTAVAYI